MFKHKQVGKLLQEGNMTRTQIAKAVDVHPQAVLMVERVQTQNFKTRVFWNSQGKDFRRGNHAS